MQKHRGRSCPLCRVDLETDEEAKKEFKARLKAEDQAVLGFTLEWFHGQDSIRKKTFEKSFKVS